MNDLRFALRQLLKNPGFTAVAVLTLAVAVGATSAIYSVVRTTIIDPLPVTNADRLMIIESSDPRSERRSGVSAMTVQTLLNLDSTFADFAVWNRAFRNFKGGEFAESLVGAEVSPNFFPLWGVAPLLGRTFTMEENQRGGEKVIILSHEFWQSRMGADPDVIGRRLEMEQGFAVGGGEFFTVIGVMPAHFKFPNGDLSFWLPFDIDALPDGESQSWRRRYRVAFRLPEEVALTQAQAMLDTISARQANDHPAINEGWRLRLGLVSDWFAPEPVRRTLWTLSAVIGLVWLIACANVANLLIARSETRQHEMAVRGALGAGRARLIRQLLTESLLLAIVGGLAGLAVTAWGIQALEAFSGSIRLKPFELNWPVFASCMVLALITGMVFGLAPAWQASRPRLQEALKHSDTHATQSTRGRLLARGLIVGEIALAVVLLSGAGLMIQSVVRLLHVDPGFQAEKLIKLFTRTPQRTSNIDEYLAAEKSFHNELHRRLAALPGVAAVGLLGGWNYIRSGETILGPDGDPIEMQRNACGIEEADPFRALGVPLLEGRLLERGDLERNTVVINKACAAVLWPGQSAIGKQFRSRTESDEKVWYVVGVVKDFKLFGFEERPRPVWYRPVDYRSTGQLSYFFIRTRTEPLSLIRPIQLAVKQADPNVLLPTVEIIADEFYRATEPRRTFMFHLSLFATVGLALALIGLYGVLAYAVARRTREIGIRMAVGATRTSIHNLILSEGMKLAGLGLALGLAGSLAATRVLRNHLFDVSPQDPATLAMISIALVVVTAIASCVPAFRATRVNPMMALRCE